MTTLRSRNQTTGGRLLLGGIAGVAGTVAMTAVMRRLAQYLPLEVQYTLPPRELVERTMPAQQRAGSEAGRETLTVLAHSAYGALAGSLLALQPAARSPAAGAAYGVLVWGASYLGWIPALRILAPATRHPTARNLMMIGAHLVWGATTAAALHELRAARTELFANGAPVPDAPRNRNL